MTLNLRPKKLKKLIIFKFFTLLFFVVFFLINPFLCVLSQEEVKDLNPDEVQDFKKDENPKEENKNENKKEEENSNKKNDSTVDKKFELKIPRKKNISCKNYAGCDFQNGYFCFEECRFVCASGVVAPGIDSTGNSLPCPKDFIDSMQVDLSGRKVCCPDPKNFEGDFKDVDKRKMKGCKSTFDCDIGEFCAFVSKEESRCALFNSKEARIVHGKCLPGTVTLAIGPDGSFCYSISMIIPGSGLPDKENNQSIEESIIENSSGGKKKPESEGGKKGNKASSVIHASSSSSGSFSVQILLQTPEIFSPKLLGRTDESSKVEEDSKAKKPTLKAVIISSNTNVKPVALKPFSSSGKPTIADYHSYYEGEDVNFSVFLKGPAGSIPNDIASYTVFVTAKEKKGVPISINNTSLEIRPKDILSTTDFKNLVVSSPPLNISLASENSKGNFTSAVGNIFMLTFPSFIYTASTSGGIRLFREENITSIPEDKCSKKGGSICGSDSTDVASCISYQCYRYSKGSPLAKNCCDGLLPPGFSYDISVPDKKDSSSSMSSSTTQNKSDDKSKATSSKPSCNKQKEIECKSTNVIMQPYCGKDLTPDCSDAGKPVCRTIVVGESNTEDSNDLENKDEEKEELKDEKTENKDEEKEENIDEKSNIEKQNTNQNQKQKGNIVKEKPSCISYSEVVDKYCKEISNLSYNKKFEAARCISDYCDYLKSPELKKGCCAGCAIVYEKLTTITPEEIPEDEQDRIKSCIGFEGGYCKDFKYIYSCVSGKCYEKPQDSDELKTCCISFDTDAKRAKEISENAKIKEEQGSVYNIVQLGAGNPIKIKNSSEDIIVQNFTLTLPKDPQISELVLNVAFRDKKKKLKSAETHFLIIPKPGEDNNENKEEDKEENKETKCKNPMISSLKVVDGGELNTIKGEPLEIPLIVTDENSDIVSFDINGISSDFQINQINSDPAYTLSQIVGTPKSTQSFQIVTKAIDECKKTSEFKFTVNILNDEEEVDTRDKVAKEIIKNEVERKGKEKNIREIEEAFSDENITSRTPIFEELINNILQEKGKIISQAKADNILIAGSKGIVLAKLDPSVVSVGKSIDLSNLEIELKSKSKVEALPISPKVLSNGNLEFEISTVGKDQEGNILALVKDKNINKTIAKTTIFIYKQQDVETLNEKRTFGKPALKKYEVINVKNNIAEVEITGKDFIGKRALINGKKGVIPRKNKFKINTFTIVEFRNPKIKVIKSSVYNKNSKLKIFIQLPEKYVPKYEDVVISTPVGQIFTKINLKTL